MPAQISFKSLRVGRMPGLCLVVFNGNPSAAQLSPGANSERKITGLSKKKWLWIADKLLALFLLILACSSTRNERVDAVAGRNFKSEKVLIVYLSRTNNTKAVAEIIHKQVGGKLVALEPEKPYPASYQATVQQVADENETGFLPPLKTKIDSIQNFDIVFIGFPTWGMQLPPPVKSFLSQYDLSGKTVIPFNTNGGYGIGSTFETVKELCPKSKVLEGFTTRAA
jgi:flavodoxin